MCSEILSDAGNAGFTECYYSLRGARMENGERKTIEKEDLVAPDNQLLTFKDTGDERVDWLYLTITTRRKY